MEFYEFYRGKSFDAYTWHGAHLTKGGVRFATYAPRAKRVSVIGEFNDWQDTFLKPVYDGKFYEITLPEAKEGQMYKFRIYDAEDYGRDHCDPYGYGMQLRPDSASVVRSLAYSFHDEKWQKSRTDFKRKPLNLYEMHLGSWKTNEGAWYSYTELIPLLIPYLKENGYNAVEFMPLSEHPCDGSWGYQNTGFYAATSRYGTPEQLMALIDALHQNEIAVVLDVVPVHFAVDGYALAKYDGEALYEYRHPDVGISEWGSYNFAVGKGEVNSFLQSCINFWLTVFHVDGIRMDAVSRLLYWQGDTKRGENGGGIAFLKQMNAGLKRLHPTAMLIAEDSTAYPKVTHPVSEGGLGFDYKWDMGWMHDTLDFFKTPPAERPQRYDKLTFSMLYGFHEHYILPLSHDETVHGKATIVQQMYGNYEDKFPQARALYAYLYFHSGKKLTFMGNEIGQLREWDFAREQDWDMLKYPMHDGFYHYMRALQKLYLASPALWEEDDSWAGFQWLEADAREKVIYVIERKAGKESMILVLNLSDKAQRYTVKADGAYRLVLASDAVCYGGTRTEEDLRLDGATELALNGYSALCFQKISPKN